MDKRLGQSMKTLRERWVVEKVHGVQYPVLELDDGCQFSLPQEALRDVREVVEQLKKDLEDISIKLFKNDEPGGDHVC